MRFPGTAVLAVVLAGCASRPVVPPSFDLAALADPGVEAAGEWDVLSFEGEPAMSGTARPVHRATLQDPVVPEVRHLTLLLGQRELDDNTAENLDIDEQFMFGIEFDASDRGTGNGFEVGISHSEEDSHVGGFSVDAELTELYGGYRKTFRPEADDYHPYVSIGGSLINADVDIGPQSDDDTTLAAYVRAGIVWELDSRFRLGVDYRRLMGEFDLFGDDFAADFDQLAVTLGLPF